MELLDCTELPIYKNIDNILKFKAFQYPNIFYEFIKMHRNIISSYRSKLVKILKNKSTVQVLINHMYLFMELTTGERDKGIAIGSSYHENRGQAINQ